VGFLKKYFVGYFIFVALFVVFLRWHKARVYSDVLLTQMLIFPSQSKDVTEDPCFYNIVGEPSTPGQYLKLSIDCRDKRANFTLDFRAIREKTVGGAIKELFRINGVTLDPAKLKCIMEGRSVTLADEVAAKNSLECRI